MASTNRVPVIQLVGTKDAGAYQSPSLTSTMMYWLERNGCEDLNAPLMYQTSGYHNQIWITGTRLVLAIGWRVATSSVTCWSTFR